MKRRYAQAAGDHARPRSASLRSRSPWATATPSTAPATSWATSRSCTWSATTSTSAAAKGCAQQSGGDGRGRGVRRLRRAGHARKPAAAFRRGGAAAAWPAARTSIASTRSSKSPRPRRPSSAWWSPGMRAGYYLCFFGMHVLTPTVMDLLGACCGGGRPRHALRGARRTGAARAIPGAGRHRPPLRHRRALRPADRATGAGAERTRPRARCWRNWWNCWPTASWLQCRGDELSRSPASSPRAIPEIRNRSLDALCRARHSRGTAGRMRRRSTASAAPATTSTSACGRCSSSTPSTASTFPSRPGAAPQAPIPFAGYYQPPEAPLRRGHRHLPRGADRRRPERRHLQRAGRRLSRPRLSDPGRPGAPQRALGARQPVDVPHRPSRRLSAAHPPRTAARRPAASSRSCARPRRSAWT